MKYTFEWPSADPHEVLLSGSFDNWAGKHKLERASDPKAGYRLTLDIPPDKIVYKFIVDGNWVTSAKYKQEADASGNFNNVLYPEDLPLSGRSSINESANEGVNDGSSGYTDVSYPSGEERNGPNAVEAVDSPVDDVDNIDGDHNSICDNIVQVDQDLSSSVQITIKDDNSIVTTSETATTPANQTSSSTTPTSTSRRRTFLRKLKYLFVT